MFWITKYRAKKKALVNLRKLQDERQHALSVMELALRGLNKGLDRYHPNINPSMRQHIIMDFRRPYLEYRSRLGHKMDALKEIIDPEGKIFSIFDSHDFPPF